MASYKSDLRTASIGHIVHFLDIRQAYTSFQFSVLPQVMDGLTTYLYRVEVFCT
mgnify:CR=1 FL=1